MVVSRWGLCHAEVQSQIQCLYPVASQVSHLEKHQHTHIVSTLSDSKELIELPLNQTIRNVVSSEGSPKLFPIHHMIIRKHNSVVSHHKSAAPRSCWAAKIALRSAGHSTARIANLDSIARIHASASNGSSVRGNSGGGVPKKSP